MAAEIIVTYTDLETFINRAFSAAERIKLKTLIAQVEAYVRVMIIDWNRQEATAKTFDGNGCRHQYLFHWLDSVTSITVDDDTVDSGDYRNLNYMVVHDDRTVWSNADDQNMVVTGDWGFEDADDCPEDLKLLIMSMCMDLFTAYFTKDNIKSEKDGDVAFSYGEIDARFGRSSIIQSMQLKYRGPVMY